jgi:hypothetical protein
VSISVGFYFNKGKERFYRYGAAGRIDLLFDEYPSLAMIQPTYVPLFVQKELSDSKTSYFGFLPT